MPFPSQDVLRSQNLPSADIGGALLVRIAASGCIRTRRDAESFRDEMRRGGYDREYLPLYRAVLALLGDLDALRLPDPQFSIARKAYEGMKRYYIGDSECRCLRTASGAVATPLATCPVHGSRQDARSGMRNLTGFLRDVPVGGKP
jgi:hypothetical protein